MTIPVNFVDSDGRATQVNGNRKCLFFGFAIRWTNPLKKAGLLFQHQFFEFGGGFVPVKILVHKTVAIFRYASIK